MAVWTREINTNYSFPNIGILNVLKDGVLSRYEAVPHEGYVMYDINDNTTEPKIDLETGELILDEEGNIIEVPIIYYFTLAGFPLKYNFDRFPWVAVKLEEINK